jgi:hypothetical protein
VVGGRSVTKIPRVQFDEYLQIDSATAFAEGLFEDPRQLLAFTNSLVPEEALVAVTRVYSEVFGFAIGRDPRLTIKRQRGELIARSPLASDQPSIRFGQDVALEGVDVGGHRLIIELDTAPFQQCDTYAKLLVGADDPAFVRSSGDALFMQTPRGGEPAPPPSGRLIQSWRGTIYATIVRSIRWDGDPYPGSQIDHNIVVIPNLGRLYFGELLISADCRRLTMVRAALGSDGGGTGSGACSQDNGSWGWSP